MMMIMMMLYIPFRVKGFFVILNGFGIFLTQDKGLYDTICEIRVV